MEKAHCRRRFASLTEDLTGIQGMILLDEGHGSFDDRAGPYAALRAKTVLQL